VVHNQMGIEIQFARAGDNRAWTSSTLNIPCFAAWAFERRGTSGTIC